MISRKGKNKYKSLTQSSIWLKTKASPFILVKGLLEVKRAVSREEHLETVKTIHISRASQHKTLSITYAK